MTSDLDIYRTANVLVKHYSTEADLEAAQRADAMLEKGSLDGQRVWKRVLTAVDEIQREEPREGRGGELDWLDEALYMPPRIQEIINCLTLGP